MVLVIFCFSDLFEYCTSNAKFRIQCSLKRCRDLHRTFGFLASCDNFNIWTKLSWTRWVVHNYVTWVYTLGQYLELFPSIWLGQGRVTVLAESDTIPTTLHLADRFSWYHLSWKGEQFPFVVQFTIHLHFVRGVGGSVSKFAPAKTVSLCPVPVRWCWNSSTHWSKMCKLCQGEQVFLSLTTDQVNWNK